MRETDIVSDPVSPVIIRTWRRPHTALIDELIALSKWRAMPYVRKHYFRAGIYHWIHSHVVLA